jgi:glycosyltransferase involved in cell wall biosynthesis
MYYHPSIEDYKKKSLNLIINKKKKPLISIITVSKNSEKTIKKTIQSIENQSSKNFEYIIVDSNSTDKTISIINDHINSVDKFISENDKNPTDGMNKGISIAEGKLIFWLASDDWIDKGLITILEDNYNKNVNCSFFYGNMIMHYNKGQKTIFPKKNNIDDLMKGVPEFPYPSILLNKKVFLEHGAMCINYKINNDYEFILRILKKNAKAKYIEKFNVHRLPGGLGEQNKILNLFETLKINIHYKTISIDFCKFFFKSIFNFSIIFLKEKIIEVMKNYKKL